MQFHSQEIINLFILMSKMLYDISSKISFTPTHHKWLLTLIPECRPFFLRVLHIAHCQRFDKLLYTSTSAKTTYSQTGRQYTKFMHNLYAKWLSRKVVAGFHSQLYVHVRVSTAIAMSSQRGCLKIHLPPAQSHFVRNTVQ